MQRTNNLHQKAKGEKEMADKKGIFDNLFGKKDAKDKVEEVVEAAKDKAEEAAKSVKEEAKEVLDKAKDEALIAAENAKRVADAARMKAETEARKAEYEARKLANQAAAKQEEAAKYIDTYTVTADDTLSHIALRFYGKATPPYYTLIYEANKDVIGANMNVIVPGQVLQIPVLPEELK